MSVGLRDRNKEKTRVALTEAAMRVVLADGIEALTAARVADEANVSRRTFFNYFARVEDVFALPIQQVVQEITQTFLAYPPEVPMREAVLRALESLLESEAFEQLSAVIKLASESPGARRLLIDVEESQAEALEDALRRRIGPDADEAYVIALAAASSSTFGRICSVYGSSGRSKKARQQQLSAALRRAYSHLLAGFDESGATLDSQE